MLLTNVSRDRDHSSSSLSRGRVYHFSGQWIVSKYPLAWPALYSSTFCSPSTIYSFYSTSVHFLINARGCTLLTRSILQERVSTCTMSAPMPGQPQPPGYAQQGYAQPQQGYAQPQQGYAQPQQGYAMPQQGYAQPQQGYAQPQQGYAMPQGAQGGYGPPPGQQYAQQGGYPPQMGYAQTQTHALEIAGRSRKAVAPSLWQTSSCLSASFYLLLLASTLPRCLVPVPSVPSLPLTPLCPFISQSLGITLFLCSSTVITHLHLCAC
jgi:hypothetical protein